MIRVYLVLSIVASLFFPQSYSSQDSRIEYITGIELSWSDFRGSPDCSSGFSALSNLGIGMNVSSYNSLTSIHIGAYFNRDSSWYISRDDQLLAHELYHFKITEYAKRTMIKEILTADFEISYLDLFLEDRFKNYTQYHKSLQFDYEKMTKFGSDSFRQQEYETFVNNALDSLSAYSPSYIIIETANGKVIDKRLVSTPPLKLR